MKNRRACFARTIWRIKNFVQPLPGRVRKHVRLNTGTSDYRESPAGSDRRRNTSLKSTRRSLEPRHFSWALIQSLSHCFVVCQQQFTYRNEPDSSLATRLKNLWQSLNASCRV